MNNMKNTSPPPMAKPPTSSEKRPPTYAVYQIIDDEGETYKMRVGSGWGLLIGGDVHKITTIHGEFEITRLRGADALH